MIRLSQALPEEAFYCYKMGRGKVWASEVAPVPHTRPLFEIKPPSKGETPAVGWFLNIASLHLSGVVGALAYWIEENEA